MYCPQPPFFFVQLDIYFFYTVPTEMSLQNKTRFFSLATVFIIVVLFSLVGGAGKDTLGTAVEAASADNVHGWAWSSNIGWVSFNCTDGGNGGIDVCASSNYGVNLDGAGLMTGYAWSSNIGWISFNASDLSGCPLAPCKAQLVGTALTGWARALAGGTAGSGGWSGWISLNCTSAPGDACTGHPYGVVLNGNAFEQFAWDADMDIVFGGNIGIGWLQFNPPGGGVLVTVSNPACSDGIDNDGDGLVDSLDPNCHTDGNPSNDGSYDPSDDNEFPACSDGIDNDGDGLVDTNDPGCHTDDILTNPYNPNDDNESNVVAACSDGSDNDGDGLVDTNDPGCHTDDVLTNPYNPNDNNEANLSSPPSLSIVATPSLIRPGDSVSITWTATNVISGSCSVTGPNGFSASGESGTQSTGPITSESTYTLTCSTSTGTVSSQVTVRVTPIITPF